jgi:hypothetical protein
MEIMVDVESLGPPPYGRLLQIGAVGFDFNKILEPHELLQRNLLIFDMVVDVDHDTPDTEKFLSATRIDQDTLDWWSLPAQQEAVVSINLSPRRGTPLECLTSFSSWIKRNLGKKARVWAKPPMFDLGLLRYSFQIVGLKCPWDHRQEACLRTLLWTAKHANPLDFKVPSITTAGLIPHYGLHDAAEQATLAQAAMVALSRPQRPLVAPGDVILKARGVKHVNQKE